MTPDIRQLLGGYATGTLTPEERARLFAAALEDQALFDALAEEQPIKDLLDDPESRGYLMAELDRLNDAAAQSDSADPGLADSGIAEPQMMARSAPARLRSAAAPFDAVPPGAAAGSALRTVPPPPPVKTPARFWLPFAAVMMALLVTGWFWWRYEPSAVTQQVALSTPPAPSAGLEQRPDAGRMSTAPTVPAPAERPVTAERPVPARTPAPVAASPVAASPVVTSPVVTSPVVTSPVVTSPGMAEARSAPPALERQAEAEAKSKVAEAPPRADIMADKSLKADPDRKKEQAEVDSAKPQTSAAAPAKRLAAAAAVKTSSLSYRLLRFENGQFVPVPTNTRFDAGDTVVILLPAEPAPQLRAANGADIELERVGEGYRSARIQLAAGPQDFVVTPRADSARSLLSREEAQSGEILRIRLNVQ